MALRSFHRCLHLGLNFPKTSTNGCSSGRYSFLSKQHSFGTSQIITRDNSSDASKEALGTKENPSSSPQETETESKLTLEIEKLNKDIEIITKKCEELDDKYKRSLADGENLRKRLTKQIDDAKIFGIQSFCKDLLEVNMSQERHDAVEF